MEQQKYNFKIWMEQSTTLSTSSIEHYIRAVTAVSKDMIAIGIISKPIYEMKRSELDIVIPMIFSNANFIEKNTRGQRMYSNGLKQFRSYKSQLTETEYDYKEIIDTINSDATITITERKSIIRSRIGQGEFRKSLIEKYNGSCIVTGISIPALLIASHIKPWAVSNNIERLSSDNGLLLSATYDRLFDSGLISFDDTGEILVSKNIDNDNKEKLLLINKRFVDIHFSEGTKRNLEYHRDVVFIR